MHNSSTFENRRHLMLFLQSVCRDLILSNCKHAITDCRVLINYCYIMYVNQKCYVKWANKLSEPFTVANGVKQGAVISPLLFSIYIDNLFKELKQLGLGCHVGPTFAGAFTVYKYCGQ